MHNKSKTSLYKKTILLTSIITINNESTAMEDVSNVPLPLFTIRSYATNPFMLPWEPEEHKPATPPQPDNRAEKKTAPVPENKRALSNKTSNTPIQTRGDQNAKQPQNNTPAQLQLKKSKNAEDVSPRSLTASVPELSSDSRRKDNMTHARPKSFSSISSPNHLNDHQASNVPNIVNPNIVNIERLTPDQIMSLSDRDISNLSTNDKLIALKKCLIDHDLSPEHVKMYNLASQIHSDVANTDKKHAA